MELCTHPILVQKEQIELTRSFYTHLYIILLTLAKIQIMVTTTTLFLSLRVSFKFCLCSEQKERKANPRWRNILAPLHLILQMILLFLMYIFTAMCLTFTNEYLYHNVPQHGTKHGTKYGTLLLMYICTTMYHNMVENLIHIH